MCVCVCHVRLDARTCVCMCVYSFLYVHPLSLFLLNATCCYTNTHRMNTVRLLYYFGFLFEEYVL